MVISCHLLLARIAIAIAISLKAEFCDKFMGSLHFNEIYKEIYGLLWPEILRWWSTTNYKN